MMLQENAADKMAREDKTFLNIQEEKDAFKQYPM